MDSQAEGNLFLFENIDKAFLVNMDNRSRSLKFKYFLDKMLLSSSPFVKYTLPYLLSEHGLDKCSLRTYLPANYTALYDSDVFSNLTDSSPPHKRLFKRATKRAGKLSDATGLNDSIENWPNKYDKVFKEPHAFLSLHLTKSLDDEDIWVSLVFVCCHSFDWKV